MSSSHATVSGRPKRRSTIVHFVGGDCPLCGRSFDDSSMLQLHASTCNPGSESLTKRTKKTAERISYKAVQPVKETRKRKDERANARALEEAKSLYKVYLRNARLAKSSPK